MQFTKDQILAVLKSENLEHCDERDWEKRFQDWLDEAYGVVTVAGLSYETSSVLPVVDPIAYRCAFADWTSAELEESFYEVEGKYYSQVEVDEFLGSIK